MRTFAGRMWCRFPSFLAISIALAACGGSRGAFLVTPTGPVVKSLDIVGNDVVSDGFIRSRIATRETTRFLIFGSVHRLDPGAVAQDIRRIRDIYQEQGFYAATVEAQVLQLDGDEVEVDFFVDEGPPAMIRTFLVDGLEGLSARAIAAILAEPPLRVGDRFVEPDWLLWKEAVLSRLREHGYADAEVGARVEVAPAEGIVDLILVAKPGRLYEFGKVEVVGNLLVEKERIREAALAVLEPGDRYAPSALDEAQGEIFSLGAFSAVTVADRDRPDRRSQAAGAAAGGTEARWPGGESAESAGAPAGTAAAGQTNAGIAAAPGPGENDRPRPGEDEGPAAEREGPPTADIIAGEPAAGAAAEVGKIPVVITVNEADFLRLRVGAGVGLDQSYYQARALAEFTHLNIFGGLQHLVWYNQLAYRLINPGAELVGKSGPAWISALSLNQPDLIRTRVDLATRIVYERELTPSYTAQSVSGRIGTPIRFRRWLYLTPSYNITRFFDVSVFDASNVAPVAPGVRPSLVGDCPSGCTLSWLEQLLVADRRDHPIETRSGWYASFGMQEGGLGGNFAWLRFTPQLRGYVPLAHNLVLAGRLELGFLQPLSNCSPEQALDPYLDAVDCSPIVVRFFGGGASGFRGFGADLLGPVQAVDVNGKRRFTPLGGNSSSLGTTELRWFFGESWSAAYFLDAGNVAATPGGAFDPANLQFALGSGLRYLTPVGPARVDIAYRFLREPTFPVNDGPPIEQNTLDYFSIFISIGEAF